MVVTLCAPERFKQNCIHIAQELELLGWATFLPTFVPKQMLGQLTESHFSLLHKAHERKIDASECVYVVNTFGYIGKDTQREIDYAHSVDKPVFYHTSTTPANLDNELRVSTSTSERVDVVYRPEVFMLCSACGKNRREAYNSRCAECIAQGRKYSALAACDEAQPWSANYSDDQIAKMRKELHR